MSTDAERLRQRELAEYNGGRDPDIYGVDKDFDAHLARHRSKPEELKRAKGQMFTRKTAEGRWMKKIDNESACLCVCESVWVCVRVCVCVCVCV